MQNNSTIKALKEHCVVCFDTILNKLKPNHPAPSQLQSQAQTPLFVTWYIGQNEDLRGCIGTFSPLDLNQGLQQYAKIAAFEDSRFNPISLKEVKDLTCGISLLTDFQDRKDAYDWEVGTHGIIIKFGQGFGGTFLPEVAAENNWTKDETLCYLIKKSGFNGDWKSVIPSIKLRTYESSKIKMSFSEYQQLTNYQ